MFDKNSYYIVGEIRDVNSNENNGNTFIKVTVLLDTKFAYLNITKELIDKNPNIQEDILSLVGKKVSAEVSFQNKINKSGTGIYENVYLRSMPETVEK
ncbi:hypothetical protein tloyanaT_21020 [Thalassotalea loyana]|uniref:DUF3127 domain-containing protein n=1 Tax=Thalassotalea loyana TaxID=280483 RepID=A0ABQ6HEA1_9GAMM|nr:hypothetical protein [Thalassotalea loyana]GLX85850.1 hypothetical protein tloyanaT_21020 [Thalassotalea loyana]